MTKHQSSRLLLRVNFACSQQPTTALHPLLTTLTVLLKLSGRQGVLVIIQKSTFCLQLQLALLNENSGIVAGEFVGLGGLLCELQVSQGAKKELLTLRLQLPHLLVSESFQDSRNFYNYFSSPLVQQLHHQKAPCQKDTWEGQRG